MGPRLVSRGESTRNVKKKWLATASMGPRLVSRGEQLSTTTGRPFSCFNGAAACEPRRVPTAPDKTGEAESFNGAAACEPRRGSSETLRSSHQARFNGAAACEPRRAKSQGKTTVNRVRFNGAAACEPRRELIAVLFYLKARGFNGAAACEPRRARHLDEARPRLDRFNGAAACEPRREPPENGQYWRAFPTYVASATRVPARSDGKTKTFATSHSILRYSFQRTSFPASVSGSPPHHLHARRSHCPVPPWGEIAGR